MDYNGVKITYVEGVTKDKDGKETGDGKIQGGNVNNILRVFNTCKSVTKKLSLTTIIVCLFHICVRAQFPSPKHDNIKLMPNMNKATVVYDLNSVRFYFKRKILLKYLKNRLKTPIYKKFVEIGSVDSSYTVLLQALKSYGNKTFFIKKSENEKNGLQRFYILGLNQLLPYVLIDGNFALFDKKENTFIQYIQINQDQTYDFKGWRQVLTLLHKNGDFLFSIQSRQTSDGNDLLETF